MIDLTSASNLALWVLVLILTATTLAMTRELAMIRRIVGPDAGALATLDGPKIGAVAPEVSGRLLDGRVMDVDGRGKRTLLVFISPRCDACRDLVPEITQFLRRKPSAGTFLVGQGTASEYSRLSALYEIPVPLILDASGSLFRAFKVNATPLGIVLDEDWTVRSKGIVNNADHLTALTRYQVTVRSTGLELAGRARAAARNDQSAE